MNEAYAVFDPNWGDPVPLLTTIRATEAEAIEAALLCEENRTTLYSGASLVCIPPVKGSWERLLIFKYSVRRICIVGIDTGKENGHA